MKDSPSSLLEAVHRNAASSPESVAFQLGVEGGRVVLTYRGLVERVQRLGAALHETGYGDGARVALCMENRPAWPVVYLSTWYAAGVAVPLDPQREPATLARQLEHSEAAAVITSSAVRPRLEEACQSLSAAPRILVVDAPEGPGDVSSWDGELCPDVPGTAPTGLPEASGLDQILAPRGTEDRDWSPRPPAGELGSLMYTSGTTGTPKGVMIRRQAVVENIEAGLEMLDFSRHDHILGVLPLFHTLPLITNCLGPLYLGAQVTFLSELTAEAIMGAFRAHRITVFVCVPAFFYRFHERLHERLRGAGRTRRLVARVSMALSRWCWRSFGWSAGRLLLRPLHGPFGPDMRLLITGGAKMSADVHADFLDWGFRLAQGYGLTEATAILTVTPLDELRPGTVGRPVAGVELRIHDADDDGIGEIRARGSTIMLGYYQNREATEEAIVDGWLCTGDLGRLLPNGHLQVTGRAKDVIVLSSGKNIYPDELEAAYEQAELVSEICIVGVPDAQGRGERLHGVVVPDRQAARRRGYANVRDMVRWEIETLGGRMPGPHRLTSLEVRNEPLPRTPTRKLQRHKVLEDVMERRARLQQGAAEPGDTGARPARAGSRERVASTSSQIDEALRMIAAQAGVADVSPEDHFDLDLGLESLDRLELVASLRERFGARLDDEAVGELHTVGELLEALESAAADGGTAPDGAREGGWSSVLENVPEGIEPFLRRRPVSELLVAACAWLGRSVYRVGAGLGWRGRERLPTKYPFILCANHCSYTDPFFLGMVLPPRVLRRVFYVGYSEYFEGRFGRLFSRWIRNVPIDANRNLGRAMQAAAEGLRRDLVLVIFPEGGRSVDGTVKRFRRGVEILATELGVPVVPVGISGTFETWPRGGRFRPRPVRMVFGDPLGVPAEPEEGEGGNYIERLREEVARLVEEAAEMA